MTLEAPVMIPPKGMQTPVATQTSTSPAPVATQTPTNSAPATISPPPPAQTPATPAPVTTSPPPPAQTQASAALIPAPVGITITPPAQTQGSAMPNVSISSKKKVIYVNAATGTDSAGESGSTEATPDKTIAYALKQAPPGTVIQLAPGSYSDKTGEVFPLVLKPGVTLRGEPANKGQNIVITGGGRYVSPTFARQDITVQAENDK